MTVATIENSNRIQDIFTLDVSACTIEVCLASVRPNEARPEFKRFRLNQPTKETFREIVKPILLKGNKDAQSHNLKILEFDVSSKPDSHEIEYVDLTKKPYDKIAEQIQPLAMIHGLDSFKDEDSFIKDMRFYVIILQPPQGQPIYFYRRYTSKKMLREAVRFAIMRNILGNTDEYEEVKIPVFLFDEEIDCISHGNDLFIFSKAHFYYMFRILDQLIESAQETLDLIQQHLPIDNFDHFARMCKKDKRKMDKLISIARQPYLNKVTIADMEFVIKEYNLYILVVEINGKKMLQLDPYHPWDILKLLNDDYLKSIMTGQNYAVDGKRVA